MKASRYSLFVEEDDRVLAVNLLSRAAIELSPEAYRTYEEYLAGTLAPPGSEQQAALDRFLDALRANLFVLDDDFDELAYIRRRVHDERFGDGRLGLVIAPTMGCNFGCHYCFQTHRRQQISSEIENRLIRLVEERIGAVDDVAVQWFGGEPLQAMPIIESVSEKLLRLCADHGATYAATVITNGSLMTADVSRRLAGLGVRRAQITLDGDRPLHDRTRTERDRKGSFDLILENIRAAPEAIEIHVRVHLAPFNRDSVVDLVDRLGRLGMAEHIDLLYFAPLFNYHVDRPDSRYVTDGKRFATSREFAVMETELLEQARERGFALKDFLDVSYGICTAVRADTLVVDPSGNLLKCYKDVGVDDEALNRLAADQPRPENLEKWMDIDIPRDEECAECTFLPVCLGGCTKQWHEKADKSVICTSLRYNWAERMRLYF